MFCVEGAVLGADSAFSDRLEIRLKGMVIEWEANSAVSSVSRACNRWREAGCFSFVGKL